MNLYIQMAYAQENDISEKMASIIMMVLGASTAAGRILFGRILQKGYLDRLRMDQLTMVRSVESNATKKKNVFSYVFNCDALMAGDHWHVMTSCSQVITVL